MASEARILPSSRRSSFELWDYGGMKERLQGILAKLDLAVLVQHARDLLGQDVTLSPPFSAGQYWICFELIAQDGRLVIGRARLPRHPDASASLTDEDERYAIACEVATMAYVRKQLPAVRIPTVYAYEAPGSRQASGVRGRLHADRGVLRKHAARCRVGHVRPSCSSPHAPSSLVANGHTAHAEKRACAQAATQEHIVAQWTAVQAEIATLAFPCIGSIAAVSASGEPVLGRLASAAAEGLDRAGPFASAAAYFCARADAAERTERSRRPPGAPLSWPALGARVFGDLVRSTPLYADGAAEEAGGGGGGGALFPLSHMDLGTQNILVDGGFHFLAVIDWEFAQTAPWPVHHYPMPFPLLCADAEHQDILAHPDHVAYPAYSKQEATRQRYAAGFRAAEAALRKQGRALAGSLADVLDSPASRIYACFTQLGQLADADKGLVHDMVRLAKGDWGDEEIKAYLQGLGGEMD